METYFLNNEVWYGGATKLGVKMPIKDTDILEVDLTINRTPNQATSLFLSNKGRYIFSERGFKISFISGVITFDDSATLYEGFDNLKGAFKEAMRHYEQLGTPSLDMFKRPIYNTWIELTFFQNQKDILTYARSIIQNGLLPGTLMIDDGWSNNYGDWKFNKANFEDAESMIKELHDLGFKIMLWLCPFVSSDTVVFRELSDRGFLIKNNDGSTYITNWWNGYSAVLDFEIPAVRDWFKAQLDYLLGLGIDGFKFDAGDSIYYASDSKSGKENYHSKLWASICSDYQYNELRVCINEVGKPLLQRLCDKNNRWEDNGVDSLIPDSLLAGLIGYPYTCPDMIGGGEYLDFKDELDDMYSELLLCHASIAALLPAMQFSLGPWRVLSEKGLERLRNIISIREEYMNDIIRLVLEAGKTGEPIVRYMEYEFPGQGMEKIIDQYMLGSDILVAPIYKKGIDKRIVKLPKGNWLLNEREIPGDTEVLIAAEKGTIILRKINTI